ncbi:MAG: hypothetical protein HPZ91_07245 [Lentisphaeria bacterium]|nr:hypothetical protein [Lentisphaeria bacterium]
MPNEAIDPAEVVLDLSTPKSEPPPEEIDPAKVKIDPYFSPTKKQFSRIREAFTSDPLAVVEDEGDRARLELESSRMPDPENFRKRYALAAYYSRMQNSDFKFVLANLDQFTAKYNDGKPQTVEAAYNDIAQLLNPPQPGEGGTAEVLKAGGSRLMQTLSNLFWTYLEGQALYESYNSRGKYGAKEREGIVETVDELRGESAGYYKDIADRNTEAALDADWFSRWNKGRWLVNAGKFLAIQAPTQAAQLAAAYYTGPLGFTALIGSSSGIDKYYDLKWDNPDLPEDQRLKNAAFTGFINSGFAWLTAGIVKGKIPVLNRIQIRGEAKASVLYFLEATGIEASQEFVEQMAENITDLHTGVYGDIEKMSPEEYRRNLWNGCGESALAGGSFGFAGAGMGYRNFRTQHRSSMQAMNSLQAERTRLLQKENLSDTEVAELQQVETALDSGNINDLAETAQAVARLEQERQQSAREAEAELTDEERTQREAEAAEMDYTLRKQLPHNPQDTIDTANELMAQFPAFRLDIVNTTGELAPEVRAKIETEGIDPARVRAWVDDSDTVHLVAENVRPSDVARTIGHEVIGHKGLRAVFGEQFDNLLDLVYRDHFEEVTKLAETYHRDTETIENQRYLTEEFLADCANAEMKPKWWKELLQQIKMGLRKIPYLRNLRFTDRDIEGALMRSARAMRRGNRTVGPDEIRFAAALRRKGAPNAAENPGQLRDGNVPHKKGFPESAGLPGERFYADYEFLYGKHPEYFDDVEHVRAAVEFVLNDPEPAGTIGENLAFVRADESTGKYFRIEVKPALTAKRHHIRSVHELTAEQYLKAKSATPPGTTTVTKPTHRQASKVSDFLRYNIDDSGVDIKPEPGENQENHDIRFSLAAERLAGEPVASVPARAIQSGDGRSAIEVAMEWVRGHFTAPVQTEIGEVTVDPVAVKQSLSHSMYQNKLDAIQAVGDVLEHGAYLGSAPDKDGKPLVNHYFAAPVQIGGNRKIVFVRTRQAEGRPNRFYVHEVFTEDEIEKLGSRQTDATSGKPDRLYRNASEFYRNIIASVMNIKPEPGENQENPDIRYSLSEYSEADRNDIIAMLKPYAGIVLDRDGADYAKYLAAKGVDISATDARMFALEATRENMKAAREKATKRRNDWLFENVPVWRDVVEAIGSENFKIVPSMRFRDEEMSGTFIAKKKETGMPSDELAQAIARRTGRDPLDIEQEVMDFFRDLKKPDLYKMYSDWKKENVLGDREAEKQMRAEWEKQSRARVEDEVIRLLERGTPVTAEWAAENRDVYRELYRQLFGGKEPPQNPGKADLEAMNAAIRQEGGNAATFAQAYRAAREKAYEEFAGKLREFKEKVLAAKTDAMKLQRDALSFAEKHLPKENRGEFARAIVKLMEVPSSPSAKYPEGRRAAEFRKIFGDILNRGAEVRKEGAIADIREMLDAAKIKRNYKGIPTSVLPSEQARVDRIRKIVSLDLPAVANMIDFNNEQLSALDADAEGSHKAEALLEDNLLLTTFGNLDYQAPDKVEAAAKQLRELISGGKAAFAEKLAERKAYLDGLRKRMVEDATFGKNSFADRGDARKHSDFMLKNESLGTLMRIASGRGIQEFDSTVGGELYRRIEDATQAEQTQLRRMQADLDKALRDIAGVDSMRKKGQFFRLLSEVVEHSGVHKTEYTRPIQTGKHDYVFEEGRRQLVSKSIPIEDYEFEGKPRKGARSLLRDIDNAMLRQGGRGNSPGGVSSEAHTPLPGSGTLPPLDETAVAFLRQQVADFDAGLKQSYEIFNDESDDANFNRMLEEERSGGRAVIFGHNPEEISRTVEVPLSQGAALQILLTWEQEHYRPNMKWNGWTEKSMEELRAFLKPEVLRMGYWMRGEIAANKAALDAKVFDRYGAHLPENDNYFPAAFRGGRSRAVRPESELGRGTGSLSINPNFLIARKFHLKPVDIDADAFSSFLGNQIEQHHFLAWADTLRDLKSVYGSAMVQKAINDNFGRNVSDNLVERIETIARGGGRFSGDYAARLLGRLYRHWVPAKIALNPSSAIKQMFGAAAYMNHIPVSDFCRGLAQANFANPEFREFVKFARNTDYMKNRLAGGLDKDLQYLMNYTRDSKAYSPLSDALLQIGTWQTCWSDAWSTLHGGFTVYKYNLEQAKKAGMSGPEAHDAAVRAWMRSTDETQQSGYLKDLNYFQSNQGAYRYLTAFLTNPIQVMNLQLQTINELRYGSDRKAAARKLAKQLFVNHLVIPSLMLFTNDMLRAGFNVADWWDEVEFEDYLLAWCLGQYEAVFLFGKLASNIGGYALKKAAGHNAYGSDVLSALPLADDLQRDIDLAARMMKQGELTESDLFGALKAIGDIGMAAGMADSRAGSVGAVLSAIGTQGKRVMKWISGK